MRGGGGGGGRESMNSAMKGHSDFFQILLCMGSEKQREEGAVA